MRKAAVLLLATSLVVGCGSDASIEDSSTTSMSTIATSTSSASTTSTSTTGAGATASPSTTVPTTVATTTSSTEPWTRYRADGTLTVLPQKHWTPHSAVGDADDVQWNQVGPDWILVVAVHAETHEPILLLIDPADRVFVLGGWAPDHTIQDWSPDGLRIVYTVDRRTVIVHLLEGVEGVIETEYSPDIARFTRPTGRDVVVGEIQTEPGIVDVYRTDGSLWSHLLRVPVGPPGDFWLQGGWLYHQDGTRVVTSDGYEVRLVTNDGETIRVLSIDARCEIHRWWAPDQVLVSCVDPTYSSTPVFTCMGGGHELWAVPIDGSPPVPIGPQAGPGGACDDQDAYSPQRVDAVSLAATLVLEIVGCCECGGDLEVWLSEEAMVMPTETECSPRLIGVRGDRAVVHVAPEYRHSVVVEVTVDGEVRVIAPDLWDDAWAESVQLVDDPPGSG